MIITLGYDSSIDPVPAKEFATAAFRFGHPLIHERIRRTDERGDYDESLMLSMVNIEYSPYIM